MLNVIPVDSKKQLKDFILLPFKIYKNESNWVPPLIGDRKKFFNPKKNPYYQHSEVKLFLALKDGEPVGRISLSVLIIRKLPMPFLTPLFNGIAIVILLLCAVL
ncbi:MAG TPA: hypothetical protein PLZ48_03185 [Candidatus Cloacimonas sp.]|nr:hypothetical protein [Candidatus Cloacimonas sp.]